ncbi:MAG: single-stranded-DNA-specific exonuclease RecJ [bacterium]
MKDNWYIYPKQTLLQEEISNSLNISSILSQILINRELTSLEDIKNFLTPSLDTLHSPFLLKDMDIACDRILQAINKKEKIIIYGDYDADGITSVSLLILTFRHFGINVDDYIPLRFNQGYGLNQESLEKIKKQGYSLVITVDCGITSFSEILYAKKIGLDVIITDHHEAKENLPEALAIISPKRKDDNYPFKDLAGVGVAFKLSQCLFSKLDPSSKEIFNFLDLVSIGTVVDVSPLINENRTLVKKGLEVINKNSNLGITSSKKIAGLNKNIESYHLSFILGPRINVLGRLSDAKEAVELFITNDEKKTLQISNDLDCKNKIRQSIEKEIFEEAVEKIESSQKLKDQKILIISNKDWHIGVIGIVASRIVEKYKKPTIIISIVNGEGKGSARSISEFHIYKSLLSCSSFLKSFGGHKLAAGLEIQAEKIEEFNENMQEYAEKNLSQELSKPKIKIDASISLQEVNFDLIKEINMLAPFGISNPRPIFLSTGLQIMGYPQILKGIHVKLLVKEGTLIREAIGFGLADYFKKENFSKINLVYSPSINTFQNVSSIQLKIEDIEGIV